MPRAGPALAARWLAALAAGLCAAVPVARAAAPPPPVVVTTDCGADMDDQWAIAHAALSPGLRLLAVVGGFAPAPHDLGGAETAACARETLAAVGRDGVPVVAGADGPLPAGGGGAGANLLARLAARHGEEGLTVLALGPATDLAAALLLDPAVAGRVGLVALAFDAYPAGGDGWNVRNDPAAWRVVLDSGMPVTVASGAVALEHLALRRGEADALLGGLGRGGAHLARLHGAWLDEVGDAFAAEVGPGRWPVWDEAVVAVALGMAAAVELPRPALGDDGLSFAFPNRASAAPFRWVTAIDRARLLGDLAGLLGAAAAPNPLRPGRH